MDNNPFTSPERASPLSSSPPSKPVSWRRTVGAVFLLVIIVPALVLFVFYYREVSVTYYMTRNPLAPAATHLATRMQRIILGNLRALGTVADSIIWTSSPPAESALRHTVGRFVQEGDLAAFAGLAVMDSRGTVLAMVDQRDISPYLDAAKKLSRRLVARGGRFLTETIVKGRVHPDVILMTAARSGEGLSGKGGVLIGLQNLSEELGKNLPAPRFQGSPGRSYLVSSEGLVLASSDAAVVAHNLRESGREALLEAISEGKSGSLTASVNGKEVIFGSALLGDVTGITPAPWVAVLEAPKGALDSQVARTRLNMDLIVFLLVPAFFILIAFILYKSFRS